MNPLVHINKTKFKDLNAEELLQVYESYCEENKYFDTLSMSEYLKANQRYSFEYTKKDVLDLINNEIGFINRIKEYFKYWKH